MPSYETKWDFYKNDKLKSRNRIISIVTKKTTNFILQNRMMKRLDKIRKFLQNAKSKDQVKKLVIEDWLKAEYKGLGKKDHVLIILKSRL